MRVLITQFCNGAKSGQVYNSSPNPLDNGNSSIFASSLFVHLDESGNNISRSKDTDDQIIIGYTKDGMAFQIIVDGFFGGDRETIFAFVTTYVVTLMEQYSSDLKSKSNSTDVTETLIKTIYSLRREHAASAEFTMSLAMTYQKEDSLFCAGFGIGDTGMVMQRMDGTIEQLVAHTEIDGFKDAFDSYSQSNIDLVISRNTVFNTKVMPGDELVGYTYIQPELELVANAFETEAINNRMGIQKVKQLVLAQHYFKNHPSLYKQLLDTVQATQIDLIAGAKASGQNQRFGDDFTVGCLVIPDKILSHQLSFNGTLIAVNIALAFYIEQETEKKVFFDFFNGTSKKIERAQLYKNLMAKYQSDCLISLVILLAMFTSKDEKQMNEYLIAYLGFPSLVSMTNMLEELIRNEISYHSERYEKFNALLENVILEIKTDIKQFINNPEQVEIYAVLDQFSINSSDNPNSQPN